jgi:hypothetical protein
MVSLAAAAVVEDRLAAVAVADPGESSGYLGDSRFPIDLLEGAVRRRGEVSRSRLFW